MALPKIEKPTFTTTLPSNGAQLEYWPMTIAQEKILLIAKEGDGENDILRAIVTIVEQCTADKIHAAAMPICDLNWMFLQIRKVSVSNIAKLSYMENVEDGEDKQHDFDVNLDQVEIKKTDSWSNRIKVNDDITLTLRPTPVGIFMIEEYINADANKRFDMVLRGSIVSVATEDSVTLLEEQSHKEVEEWIRTLPSSVYTQVEEYLAGMPTLHYEIKYTDSKGEEQKIVLSELTDFFTF